MLKKLLSCFKIKLKKAAKAGQEEKGVFLTEFAYLLPLFLLLIGGAIDVGLASYTKMKLESVATTAVRSVNRTMANATNNTFNDIFRGNIENSFADAGYITYDANEKKYVSRSDSAFGDTFFYDFRTESHTVLDGDDPHGADEYTYHSGSGTSFSARKAYYCYEDIYLTVSCVYHPKTFVMAVIWPDGITFETTAVSQVRIDP